MQTSPDFDAFTAAYDAATGAICVSQDFIGPQFEVSTSASATAAVGFTPNMGSPLPLIMAAMPATHPTGRPAASHFFNGKLDRPRLVGTAELLARQREREEAAEHEARIESGTGDRRWFDAAAVRARRARGEDIVELDDGVFWSPAKASAPC